MKWESQKNKYKKSNIAFKALLLFVLFFCLNGYSQIAVFSDEEVIEVAAANLQEHLTRIQADPQAFGFNNTDEFDLIEIGHPYELQFLSDYFMSDSLFIQSGRYFSSKNEWFVPLY
ncbi:MAG: hypothetical protein JW798_15245, partial [Prolixibacteraceae bacterium]|nr:hypothetical protein [Prolixibacteraceae bacterium]